MADIREANGTLAAALDGDERAFAELYRAHLPLLTVAIQRVVGYDDALVADLMQETWLRAWRSLHRFRGDSSLSTWLHRIASNVAVGRVRRKRLDTTADPLVFQRLAAPGGVSAELRMDLERAIDALPDRMRQVLWLHDVEGWTHREIGDMLGIADGTSKSQLCRARAHLRRQLEARPAPPATRRAA